MAGLTPSPVTTTAMPLTRVSPSISKAGFTVQRTRAATSRTASYIAACARARDGSSHPSTPSVGLMEEGAMAAGHLAE